MSAALRQPMSLEKFLAWEERQEERYEFDGFRPVAMPEVTVGHDRITFNLRKALDARLAGRRCRPFGPNVKILAAGKIRYPDAVVTCVPVDRSATIIDDPVVIFEVVSPGISRVDRIEKLREYAAVPSLQAYVILEQDSMAATILSRRGADPVARAVAEGEAVDLPAIDILIPLSEIYVDIAFSEPSAS